MRVLAIDGSPTGGGRTSVALRRVLEATAAATTALVSLADTPVDAALDEIQAADAFVFGSPIYRATYAAPLKALLDRVPRGLWGESTAPLRGKAVVVVATGASLHHFLALDSFRNVLSGFFAAHVVPPGLYVPREGFADEHSLDPEYEQLASAQGEALAELAAALAGSNVLKTLDPQA